jgi:TRAP transporter 4TM/12TM fusion protein
MNSPLIRWGAFLFGVFHVYTNIFASLSELWFSAIHFGGFGALCALSFHDPATYKPGKSPANALRILLAALSVACAAYLILFEDALYARDSEFMVTDYLFASLAVLLAIDFTRRTSGWFMPALIVVSLSYMLFLGRFVSGVFAFPGLSLETVLYRSYFSSTGMFGFVASISASYVFMFILFGSFLLKSGAADFIIKLAHSVGGRFTGGAGMVAVAGSALMGSVTGSAVANTVSTGVITIPMMKRSGFPPRFAAAVEAAASTGGQLMPPVMGAGAFVIASYTQIPYTQIIAVSVLPAAKPDGWVSASTTIMMHRTCCPYSGKACISSRRWQYWSVSLPPGTRPFGRWRLRSARSSSRPGFRKTRCPRSIVSMPSWMPCEPWRPRPSCWLRWGS